MSQTDLKPFQALTNTTAPAFSSSALGSTSHFYSLESTGLREFQWPSNRMVRVVGNPDVPYTIKFGTSDVIAASSNSALAWGKNPEVFTVDTAVTHVSVVSSTTITVNFTLGQGA
jgi:hypothetical protein